MSLLPHPYTSTWCSVCGNPDGDCTGVRSDQIDLNRIVDEDIRARIVEGGGPSWDADEVTIAEVIEGMAGIGHGGHLYEPFDEEEGAYDLIAADAVELAAIQAARHEYGELAQEALDGIIWPPKPTTGPLLCDRHGGPWGEDLTCARCTYQDGTVRPPLDDPGPLGPGAETGPEMTAEQRAYALNDGWVT